MGLGRVLVMSVFVFVCEISCVCVCEISSSKRKQDLFLQAKRVCLVRDAFNCSQYVCWAFPNHWANGLLNFPGSCTPVSD